MVHKLAVLLFAAAAAAISCGAAAASGGDVDTFSFPVFNATTMSNLFAGTNFTVLLWADQLLVNAKTNRSEGFLLLTETIHVWRARDGAGLVPDREASFNSTFTLSGPTPVAFVVLKNSFPTLNTSTGLRGSANRTSSDGSSASAAGVADVEAGAVRSYEPEDPVVGLNVTVTPNGTVPSRTVWVEYNATAHRLYVYVAAGGQAAAKPARPTLDAELYLAGGRTTETANVGFFAGKISDIIDGVSGWELTVEKLPGKSHGNRAKDTSWVMILLAVLLSVAATAAI